MKKLQVIKIGGNVIDDDRALERFLSDFSQLSGHRVLVHGGGKIATRMAEDLGIESKMIDGRRITDGDSLRIVTMVYAGLINKGVTAALQSNGCNAIGLTGADGNLIRARKRPVRQMADGTELDFGFVGDLDETSVETGNLSSLLEAGFVPVFSAITHNGSGQLLNTNADTIAASIAIAMSGSYATSLVYCFEKRGVLRNVDDEQSVIKEINPDYYRELKEGGFIHSGMIPKLDNAFSAISKGVKNVYIGHADALAGLDSGDFGTRLTQDI